MTFPNWVSPYLFWVKAGAIVLVLAATFAAGYRYRDARADAQVATIREQVANDARAQIEVAEKRAYDADEALRKAQQKIPQTGQKVADAVREHPTSPDCVVPDDVAQRLQDGIDAGKANSAG